MSKIHRSADGKWRTCEAKIKCGLTSGHVSSENMQNASIMMNTMGFDSSKSLSGMSAQDIEQLGAFYENKRSNTPAFLLSDTSNGYVPPIGLVLPLNNVARVSTFENAKIGKFFNEVVETHDIKGNVETEKIVKQHVNASSAALEKVAITKVSFEVHNSDTDEKKTVSFAKKMKVDGPPPSVPVLLSEMFRSAKYAHDTGIIDPSEANIKEYAAKNRKPANGLLNIVPKGLEDRKILVELFGESTYESMVSQISELRK